MTFERGELLLVPFPFTDLSAAKRRPVLALTRPDPLGDFIALPVTSRPHHVHVVPLGTADLVVGSLPAASWIRTDRVVSLSESLVIKSIGSAAEHIVAVAVGRLCEHLGRS